MACTMLHAPRQVIQASSPAPNAPHAALSCQLHLNASTSRAVVRCGCAWHASTSQPIHRVCVSESADNLRSPGVKQHCICCSCVCRVPRTPLTPACGSCDTSKLQRLHLRPPLSKLTAISSRVEPHHPCQCDALSTPNRFTPGLASPPPIPGQLTLSGWQTHCSGRCSEPFSYRHCQGS